MTICKGVVLEGSRIKGSTAFIIILLIASQLLFISDSGGTVSRENERSRDNQTLIVNATGSGYYSSIYGAIIDANDGDTVYVEAGTYNESVEITSSINLVGAGAEKTTIRGLYFSSHGIHITAHGVKLTGFTIMTVGSTGNGIEIVEANNCSITDNIIITYHKGISITNSRDIVLAGNSIVLNRSGDFDEKQLISISESTGISLMGNDLEGNGISITGETLEHWNTHTVDDENYIDGKKLIYWNEKDGGTVPQGCGQVIIVDCTNVTVQTQKIENCHNGITLAYSSFSTVSHNDCSSNEACGIHLYRSNNNIVNENNCRNSENGISLVRSYSNTIRNNSCSGRSFGIYLDNSGNNTIEYNSCNSSIDGIHLQYSDNNSIDNNTCHSNTDDGIYISFSDSPYVTNNRCSWNTRGIVLYYSLKASLDKNIMEGNGLDIVGDYFEYLSGHDIPDTNTVNGKTVYYRNNVKNDTIPADGGRVILVNCSGILVEGLEMNDTFSGISLYFSNGNLISNNTCINNLESGVDLYRSSGNTITGNSFHTRGDPDYLDDYLYYYYNHEYYDFFSKYCAVNLVYSNNNTILNNVCNSDIYNGITIHNSNNNSIRNNTCARNPINGIGIYDSMNSVIEFNNCHFNGRSGILLYSSTFAEIFNNTCDHNNKSGIELRTDYYSYSYSSYINLTNNTCRGNKNHAIQIIYCKDIALSGNMMWDNGLSLYASDPDQLCYFSIDTSNRVNDRPIYFWKEAKGGTVPRDAGQVILASCSDVVVRDLCITNVSMGISVFYSSDILITNNTCEYNSDCGIKVTESERINITYNVCRSNICSDYSYYYSYYYHIYGIDYIDVNGIELSGSFQCAIENNSCNYNQGSGITTDQNSYSNTISHNNCDHNGNDGLYYLSQTHVADVVRSLAATSGGRKDKTRDKEVGKSRRET